MLRPALDVQNGSRVQTTPRKSKQLADPTEYTVEYILSVRHITMYTRLSSLSPLSSTPPRKARVGVAYAQRAEAHGHDDHRLRVRPVQDSYRFTRPHTATRHTEQEEITIVGDGVEWAAGTQ